MGKGGDKKKKKMKKIMKMKMKKIKKKKIKKIMKKKKKIMKRRQRRLQIKKMKKILISPFFSSLCIEFIKLSLDSYSSQKLSQKLPQKGFQVSIKRL